MSVHSQSYCSTDSPNDLEKTSFDAQLLLITFNKCTNISAATGINSAR